MSSSKAENVVVSAANLCNFLRRFSNLHKIRLGRGVVLRENMPHVMRSLSKTTLVYLDVDDDENVTSKDAIDVCATCDIRLYQLLEQVEQKKQCDLEDNEEEQCDTMPRNYTLQQVLKRPFQDIFETPERLV